ncbi:MAG TPA: PAS domain S-box protein [Negativicutes bacterium]|nr:PAS domain S-box protein [Negativicutes bacterium]
MDSKRWDSEIFAGETAFFRDITEQARDIILGVKFDGSICYANQTAVSVYGYTPGELKRMHIRDLRAPETVAEIAAQLEKAKDSGALFRTTHLRRNGTVFPVEVSTRKIRTQEGELILSIVRDITVSVEIEEECRDAQEYAEKLLDTANAIITTVDMEGRIKTFNMAAERITGYKREDVLGKVWFDFLLPPTEQARAREYLRSVTEPDFCKHYESKILTKQGEIRHILWQSNAVLDHEEIVGLLAFGIDITDKKRAEETILHQEELLRGILDGLEIPYCVIDRSYRYLTFNQTYARLLQERYGAKVSLHANLLDVHAKTPDKQKIKRSIDQALKGKTNFIEKYIGDENHDKKYYSVKYQPIMNDCRQIIGVAITGRDISNLKRAEEEAHAGMRYRELVEETQVIVMAVNSAAKIGFINEYGLQFFGFPAEKILGQVVGKTIVPEMDSTGRNLWEGYENFWSHGKDGTRDIFEHKLYSGKRAWVDWTIRRGANPLTGESGWLCVGVDVTAKMRLLTEEQKGADRRRCNELMNDIISRRLCGEAMYDAANRVRIDLTGPFVCVVIQKIYGENGASENGVQQPEWNIVVDSLKTVSRGIVWETQKNVAVLLPCYCKQGAVTLKDSQTKALELWKMLKKFDYFGLGRLGVSYQAYEGVQIPVLYDQAQAALEFGMIQNPTAEIFNWYELGWMRLLLQNVNNPEAKRFVDEQLGSLLNMQHLERREVLLETLRDLLSGETVESMAARKNVHRQTIRYRKRMLEEQLGVCWSPGEVVVNLSIAYKILLLQQCAAKNSFTIK